MRPRCQGRKEVIHRPPGPREGPPPWVGRLRVPVKERKRVVHRAPGRTRAVSRRRRRSFMRERSAPGIPDKALNLVVAAAGDARLVTEPVALPGDGEFLVE